MLQYDPPESVKTRSLFSGDCRGGFAVVADRDGDRAIMVMVKGHNDPVHPLPMTENVGDGFTDDRKGQLRLLGSSGLRPVSVRATVIPACLAWSRIALISSH